MTFPVRSTDHRERGVARLLCQFRKATKLQGIVGTYLDRLQSVETTTWDVIDHMSIDAAEGALLNALGKLAGAGRGALTDALFRVKIRVRIRINRSNGLIEDLLDVFRLATTGIADASASLEEYDPATVLVDMTGIDPDVGAVTTAALIEAKAAGVKMFVVTPGTTDPDRLARWDTTLINQGYPFDEIETENLGQGTSYDDEESGAAGLLSYVAAS